MRLLEIKLEYKMPNFNYEWDEAQRYPKLAHLGKGVWLSLAKHGRKIRLSALGDVSNMDPYLGGLDPDKVARAKQAYSQRTIELPIVIRTNGKNDLLGGNTRIAYLLSQDVDPIVWFVNVDNLLNNFDK